MQRIRQLGNSHWSIQEMKDSIPLFLELYQKKPLKSNEGGMNAPHMFATWFMLRKLAPANVIESGIWKGQGTWLIEHALPQTDVYSIDINLKKREYVSDKVRYFDKDFSLIDWSMIQDRENTVLFFDDHQNAIERIKQGALNGFKHFIFEDNYPQKQGDCYSLKKAFQGAGFKPSYKGAKAKLLKFLQPKPKSVIPNSADAQYLEQALDIYYEFPPVFKSDRTRWNDPWTEEDYPTPAPLYNQVEHAYLELFFREARDYTWICYAKLK